ncbi:helix-turn-helix domain-containing protein [Actinoplanes sp. NPDC051861]|uniref:helix-turn-helix domain-containing protein n=1 Tax=Actinoplanes sp. NPDC051861 TaxID=3155170 RepID=UPI003442747E
MAQPGADVLAHRLRELRGSLKQQALAKALGVSVPLISSWEHGKAVPPPERIEGYARFFALGGDTGKDVADFEEAELQRFRDLRAELFHLRPSLEAPGVFGTKAPQEGMWHFPDRAPVTIVCAALPKNLRADLQYTSPESPDYIELYTYADLDALMELYGHLVAANPGVAVNRKLAGQLTPNDLTNHLVLLGGVDWNPMTGAVIDALEVPVSQELREEDPDIGAFRVFDGDREQVFRSVLEEAEPHPRLVQDVAQFCRGPNPFNQRRTVTICNGNYGRGTLAAVRTLTDPRFRDRNRGYVEDRFGAGATFSILARVNIVQGMMTTPDWTLDGTVLHEWSRRA